MIKDHGLDLSNRNPKPAFKKRSTIDQAIKAKLISDRNRPGATSTNPQRLDLTDQSWMHSLSEQTATNITDNLNIRNMMADTTLAEQILLSSILSPKDMVTTEINFTINDGALEGELAGALLKEVTGFFENVHKIKDFAYDALKRGLFETGSTPVAIIPENAIDHLLASNKTVSSESGSFNEINRVLQTELGILGDGNTNNNGFVSMEALVYRNPVPRAVEPKHMTNIQGWDPRIDVSDNVSLLKTPALRKKITRSKVLSVINQNFGIEGITDTHCDYYGSSLRGKEGKEFRDLQGEVVPMAKLTPQEQLARAPIGEPLDMILPSESVIPVFVPGSPDDHVGYFILLDQNGNFLDTTENANYYRDLTNNYSRDNQLSSLVHQTRRALEGRQMAGVAPGSFIPLDSIISVYTDLVVDDLQKRLKTGIYGDGYSIARPSEVYRIMLARGFCQKSTRLLFVPREMMVYIAFDYNKYGIGQTVLENLKIFATMRAVTMFANNMQSVHNSINYTDLNIKLDPEDPDPAKRVEFFVHEFARNRKSAYPLSAGSPLDIVTYLQNAGVRINVEGHDGYMQTQANTEDRNRSVGAVDTGLEERLTKLYYMGLGLSPEVVDLSNQVEFATSIVTSNLLLAKRVIILQDILCRHLTDYVRKYIYASGKLTARLMVICEKNPGLMGNLSSRAYVAKFVSELYVELPRPDTAQIKSQHESYVAYKDALDEILEVYFSADLLDSTSLGDQADMVEPTKAALRAFFLRRFLRSNNILPELFDLTTVTKDNHPTIDLMGEHAAYIEAMAAGLEGMMTKIAKNREERQKRDEAIGEAMGVEITSSNGYDSSSDDYGNDDNSEGGKNDDGSGGEDFDSAFDDEDPSAGSGDKDTEEAGEPDEPDSTDDGATSDDKPADKTDA